MAGRRAHTHLRRAGFWLAALLILACAFALQTVLTRTPIAAQNNNPSATPTAVTPRTFAVTPAPGIRGTPSPTPNLTSEPDCLPAPITRLTPGERGRVVPEDPFPLNLRVRPGAAPEIEILYRIPSGGIFYVLQGPQCEGIRAWWLVAYRPNSRSLAFQTPAASEVGGPMVGWVAEGVLQNGTPYYYVEPYPPGS